MKAQVLYGIDDLKYCEVDKPKPSAGQVLVEVKAAGICGSDIARVFKTGTYHFPTIPGHEFSGVVAELGEGVDASWIGKRVGVFPLIPCMECEPCKKKQYEMCKHYNYLGSRKDGGFAEFVCVPEWNLIELPGSVSFDVAAMLEPLSVAEHAIRKASPEAGDFIAVQGLGTIGMGLALLLKAQGFAKVICIGNKEYQKEMLVSAGIDGRFYIDSTEGNLDEKLLEVTEGHGVDVFFECVGKNETVATAVRNAAASGKVQLVGNPASDMTLDKATYWKILRQQLTVRGSWNSSFDKSDSDDWHRVLSEIESGRLEPTVLISHRLNLKELGDGLKIMRDKTELYTKIMVVL